MIRMLSAAFASLLLCLFAGCAGDGNESGDRDAGGDRGTARKERFPTLSGDYLGQTPPGAEPELFAPDVVSTGLYERDVAMTPDGNEFYFGLLSGGEVTIVVSKRERGVWSPPEIAPFCDDAEILDLEPHITPDGKRFLFLSTRPGEGKERKPGWANQDIWAMERTADGWGTPYNLGLPVCTDEPEYFPSVTREGTLYFTREVTVGERKRSLIFRARMVGGGYAEPGVLPDAANPGDHQFNAFVDPDERYLIVGIAEYEDNIGAADYYVCFRGEDDTWTGPVNMGPAINTPGNRVVSPYVSPDGKYFFFASNRGKDENRGGARRSYETIRRMASEPQNGSADIYWVHASFIDKLRP